MARRKIQQGAVQHTRRRRDELAEYLEHPVESVDYDDKDSPSEFTFWGQTTIFSNLKRMANAYLAVPTTSVPCERIFSESKFLTRENRNKLKPDTVRKLMLVKHWSKRN
ncbi:hypothetical protein A0J61_10634 [Choanephora cucurbitarum]|uniref:HAT C-terminal dimerisation domain-containing protein n=1 Tax=Choanephora cucurbitarum TaxID=101091 RepID=A0A1C7MWQ9_9FUNG|nr:hypothetical protein A0J61_10634 [Choanephora cucurbitarum]